MSVMEQNRKRSTKYILSFVIPFVMYMIIGIIIKLYPLSDNTILSSDLNSQFITFFNFFKNQFSTNNDFIYTFSKNLGGDMVGFSAYYLHNPFLFILFLFPHEYMPLGIYITEAIMLSTASLSFMYYLMKVHAKGNLLFSTCYGMMGYVTAYFMLPIYFCNIIMLPVVMVFFHGLMSEECDIKDRILYSITLAMSIFFNYYIGYMLCIFLFLYYIYYCGCSGKIVKFKEFILHSVIGVMLACFNLVPVVLSLRDQKDAPSEKLFDIGRTFKLSGLYRNLLPGTYALDLSNSSMPYIYVGILPIVCVLLLLLSRKVDIKEKLSTLFLIGTFIISFYIRPFNTVWHAFNDPVGFSHRFAFYFSFILLSVGYKAFLNIEWKTVYIKHMIIALSFLEIFYNSYHSLDLEAKSAARQSEYMAFYERVNPLIEEIKNAEGKNSLYRIEKDIMYTMVDPMAFDYAGLSHNSSCEKAKVKDFMSKMGFRNQGIWAFYNQGSTAFADSFLGVKYFISRFDSTDKPYNPVNNNDDTFVYENPYALKFASFMDEQKVLKLSNKMDSESDKYLAKAGSGVADKGNTFELQNEIAACYKINNPIFTEAVLADIKVKNVNLSDAFIERVKKNKVDITYISDDNIATEDDDLSNERYIEFNVDIDKSGRTLYMYFLAPKMQGARIYVNGIDWDDYFSDYRWAVERVGTFNEGDLVNIKIVGTGDELTIDDYLLYYEDYEALKGFYESANNLGASDILLNKITSSHIKGTFNAKEDSMLVLTIPYEKGWHIKIDGESVNHSRVLYVLTGVSVQEGEHTIEMRYVPQGIVLGTIISFIALILLISLYLHFGKSVLKE